MSVYIWHQGQTGRKESNLQARRVRDRGTGYSAESSKVRLLQRRRVRRSRKGKFKPSQSEPAKSEARSMMEEAYSEAVAGPARIHYAKALRAGLSPGVLTLERASRGVHDLFH
jgi:hypothetical protein